MGKNKKKEIKKFRIGNTGEIMRSYVQCPCCSCKMYLNVIAESRLALSRIIGVTTITIQCCYCRAEHSYDMNDVTAEKTGYIAPVGAILGGLIGAIILGPVGGLIIGLCGGKYLDIRERLRVEIFNNSEG